MEDLRYIYSIARVRVLETRLIKKDTLINMATAPSLSDALKIWEQTGSYPMDIQEIKDSLGLEGFINLELLKLDNLARELFVDTSLYTALRFLKKDLSYSYSLIKSFRYEFLKGFIKRAIDLANIKTFLRLRYQRAAEERLNNSLVSGGYIQRDFFLNFFSQDLNNFINAFSRSEYKDLLRGVTGIEADFATLEKEMDNFLINFIKPAKYLCFSPEPIFGYVLAKENELKTIRLIILAKLNNIPKEFIRERMSDSYVA